MHSVKPVIKGMEGHQITYAEEQPEYAPLTVLRTGNGVMSRWRFSEVERARIAAGEDLFICQLNFGTPLQPICPAIADEEEAMRILVELTT